MKPRKLLFDSLEARQLLASGADFYELKSEGPYYADDYFFQTADPVTPSVIADGQLLYDLSRNAPGDQTIELYYNQRNEQAVRIKVDPAESYQFSYLTLNGEGAIAVDALNESGQPLGRIGIPVIATTRAGQNYFNHGVVHAVIGPSGRALPEGTAFIEIVAAPLTMRYRFGFVQDAAFTFETQRSVDLLKAPVKLAFDPAQSYTLSAKAIVQNAGSVPSQIHTLGYLQYDVDQNLIEPIHVQKYADSVDARLASPLNPGDTTMELTSTVGWSNSSYDPRTRSLAWYGYRNAAGNVYADYTYTRLVARDEVDGVWSRNAIQGNRITLNKPWSGPALPAGTAMRNALDGEALVPALLDHRTMPGAMTAVIQGQWQDGKPNLGQAAPGTHTIQLAAEVNQSSVDQDERVTVRMQLDSSDHVVVATPENNQRVLTLDVLANDGPAAGTIVSATNGVRGSVEISSNGRQLIYRPAAFFIGTDAFSYDALDQSGSRITRQVMIKSLGSNLDSDPALATVIAANQAAQTAYFPNFDSTFAGVKNQTLRTSLHGTISTLPHYYSLDEIGYHAGSLSLQANGDFEYAPVAEQTYSLPFDFTAHSGADQQPIPGNLFIEETEFRRDQFRLQRLGLGQHNFESANRTMYYPASAPADANGMPFLSWRVYMLPHLGYQELFDRFKLNEPWNSAANLPLLAEMPDVFRSGNDGPMATSTRYQVLANTSYPNVLSLPLNNVDRRGNLTRLSQYTDDWRNTMLIVQAGMDKAVPWTQPVDLPYDYANPIASLGNVGGYFNAYVSGKVHAFPVNMGNATFQALATPAQGDYADPDTVTRAARDLASYPGDPYVQNLAARKDVIKQLMLGMHNFYDTYRRFAPVTPAGGTSNLSWRVAILPFIGSTTLYNQFRFDEPWDSPHNLSVAANMPDIFRSMGDPAHTTTTRIRLLGGSNMAYGGPDALRNGPRMASFTDGTSNSILLVEAGIDKAVPWTKPDVLPVDLADFWGSMGDLPDSQILLGMTDGSVMEAPSDTPNANMIGLATINQGDPGRSEFNLQRDYVHSTHPLELRNNLKQIGLAAHNFESAFRFFPSNFSHDHSSPIPTSPNLSWRVAILPYLEEYALYEKFNFDEPWDSPHNLSLLPLMPDVFKTGLDQPGTFMTRIQRFAGRNTIDPNQKIKLNQITDGTSNTIFAAVVAPEKAVPWTKPDDIEFNDADDWSTVGHLEVMEAVLADASVSQFRYEKELGVQWNWGLGTFNQLVLRNDGAVLGLRSPTELLIGEGVPFAFNITQQSPLILELEDPSLARASAAPDGYLQGFGAQQRITIEGLGHLNGVRRTKLLVKTPASDPTQPPILRQTFDVTIYDVDDLPTMDVVPNVRISEDASPASFSLTGITSGSDARQDVTIRARSLTPAVIADVSVEYQTGSSTASVRLTPVANASGTAVVEVTAINAGPDGDFNTEVDNGILTRLVTIIVEPVNDPPSISMPPAVTVLEDSRQQTTTITGISAGPGETQPLRVTASTSSLSVALASTNLIVNGSSANLRWTPVADQSGVAVIVLQVEDGGLDNDLNTSGDNGTTLVSYTVTIEPENDAPTITRPANQLIPEDTIELLVPLEDVSAGPYETGDVRIRVASSNSELVSELDILPQSPRVLRIQPQPNRSGSSMITVRVEDSGADGNFETTADNLVTLATFELVVQPTNDMPQMDSIDNMLVDVGSSELTKTLTGLSSGINENQPVKLTARSAFPNLVAIGTIDYVTGGNSATLRLLPNATSPAVVTIEVTVEDGGLDENLATKSDNLSLTRQFSVTVNVPPVASPDRFKVQRDTASFLNVLQNDSDMDDTMTVVIDTAPPVGHGTVTIIPDNTLQFVAAPGFTGPTSFTYHVVDSHGRSSASAQVVVGVLAARYQNPFDVHDVNGDGFVTALDALLIINVLNDPNHPRTEDEYFGQDNLDTNADRQFSAIDALLVINELNKVKS